MKEVGQIRLHFGVCVFLDQDRVGAGGYGGAREDAHRLAG